MSLSLFGSDMVVTLVLLLLRVKLSSLLEYLCLVGIKEGPGKVHLLQFVWNNRQELLKIFHNLMGFLFLPGDAR